MCGVKSYKNLYFQAHPLVTFSSSSGLTLSNFNLIESVVLEAELDFVLSKTTPLLLQKKGHLFALALWKTLHQLSVSFSPLSVSVFIHLHLIVLEVLSHIVTKVILPPARCCSVYLAEKGSSISFFSVNRDPFPQVRTVLPSRTTRKYASQIKEAAFSHS